jgi:hypothetical protein
MPIAILRASTAPQFPCKNLIHGDSITFGYGGTSWATQASHNGRSINLAYNGALSWQVRRELFLNGYGDWLDGERDPGYRRLIFACGINDSNANNQATTEGFFAALIADADTWASAKAGRSWVWPSMIPYREGISGTYHPGIGKDVQRVALNGYLATNVGASDHGTFVDMETVMGNGGSPGSTNGVPVALMMGGTDGELHPNFQGEWTMAQTLGPYLLPED